MHKIIFGMHIILNFGMHKNRKTGQKSNFGMHIIIFGMHIIRPFS